MSNKNSKPVYNLIWWDGDSVYTLAHADGTRVEITGDEATDDDFAVIYSQEDIDFILAQKMTRRFAITPAKLTELLGIV